MAEVKGNIPGEIISDQIIQGYVRTEAGHLLGITEKTPPGLIDGYVQSSDQNWERTEQELIKLSNSTLDPKELRKKGLEAARDFWTQKLGSHTLLSAQETFGISRLGQINQRLEEFNKPPEPSK